MANDILFKVVTPLGFSARVTRAYWELIVTVRHPMMRGREVAVQSVLQIPEEAHRSRGGPNVLLFYRVEEPGRWLYAVARRLDDEGFLITTCPTDAIKEGERLWSR